MIKVRVHPGYRWSDVQIAGRIFSKHSDTFLSDAEMNDEIRRVAKETEDMQQILVVEGDPEQEVEEVTEDAEENGEAEEVTEGAKEVGEAESEAEGEGKETKAESEVLTHHRRHKRG